MGGLRSFVRGQAVRLLGRAFWGYGKEIPRGRRAIARNCPLRFDALMMFFLLCPGFCLVFYYTQMRGGVSISERLITALPDEREKSLLCVDCLLIELSLYDNVDKCKRKVRTASCSCISWRIKKTGLAPCFPA